MTMITPSYLGETIEYSSLHACRSTLEDPTGFLLSLSLPMFFFAATTAYDILRSQGVPLGKRDFMGPLRLKS